MLRRTLKIALLIVALLAVIGGLIGYFFRGLMGDKPQAFFNALYKHPMGYFSKDPNTLLVETVSSLKPGKALDVAMGEGRNAIWLATKGWDVTGFDISDEALRQAVERARRAGVTINTVQAASENFDYGHDKWDLIVMSYAFAPIQDAGYVARLRDSLKPGGLLVFEHYQRTSASVPGTLSRGQAKETFREFKILRCEESAMRGDWVFRLKLPLVRLVATR